MRDRYRHWYTRDDSPMRMARPIMAPRVKDLEDLVLQDLLKAVNDEERVRILDSYSIASQRKYRNDLHQAIVEISQRFLSKIIGSVLEVNLPEPQPPWHPNIGVVAKPEEDKSEAQ